MEYVNLQEEVVEDTEEVTLERLLGSYQPSEGGAGGDDDDSEVPRVVLALEARESLATLSLYIQQHWGSRNAEPCI